MKSNTHAWRGRAGLTLFVVVLVLAAMGILGLTILSLAKLDVEVAGQYKKGTDALYHADAGVQYAFQRVKADVDAGTLVLDTAVESVNYPAPVGFSFDTITTLTRLPDGRSYLYRVTGHALDASASIEAVFRPPNKLPYGLFGGQNVKVSGTGSVVGDTASNGDIQLSGTATIDGDATPGPGCSVDADPGDVTGSTAPATEVVVLDPVDPVALADAMVNNNNASVAAHIDAGGVLIVETVDVTLDAGVYYFTHVSVKDPKTLHINGKVEIYCTGKFEIAGRIDNPSADPDYLNIWIDGTEHIDFSGVDTYANLYAPDANEVKLKSGTTYYGSCIVGGKVDVGDAHYVHLPGSNWGAGTRIISWKQLRE